MSKIEYQVIQNGEVIDTRTSTRTYTHAVTFRNIGLHGKDAPKIVTYCGNAQLAEKRAQTFRGRTYLTDIIVLPVSVVSK